MAGKASERFVWAVDALEVRPADRLLAGTASTSTRAGRCSGPWRWRMRTSLSFADFKQVGVGLATAVLIDATIIRGVLLPASMKLLGDWNWYLPSWLGWIPGSGRGGPERHSPGPPPAAIPEPGRV